MAARDRRSTVVRVGTIAAFAVAVGVCAAAKPPTALPSIALGSTVVLAAERVTALMIAFVLLAVILDRGMRGDLPIELRGVKYADREAADELARKTSQALLELADAIEALDARLENQELRQ